MIKNKLVRIVVIFFWIASQLTVLFSSLPLIPCAFNRYEGIVSGCLSLRYIGVVVSFIGIILTLPLFKLLMRKSSFLIPKVVNYILIAVVLIETAIFARVFLL